MDALHPKQAVRRSWRWRNPLYTAIFCGYVMLLGSGPTWTQSAEPKVPGEWRMDLRILKSQGLALSQRDIILFVSDESPDGTYRVLTHLTTDAVADDENRLSRPECKGKMECTYDDASEGIGRLIGDKFYIDWLDDAWIDDVFTISGNKMTGDDGNGPLDFTKVD